MKKFLLLGTMFVATGALAFGGVGLGLKSSSHKGGVSAIGVHINPNGKKADIDILEPCPDGLERNTDGSCTVCKNGNVYLSYMDAPCGIGPINQLGCSENDCSNPDGNLDRCCNETTQICQASIAMHDNKQCLGDSAVSCASNKDCTDNEFCNVVTLTWGLPDTGTCAPIGEIHEYIFNGETFWGIPYQLEWWGAENWCKALGKRMVTLADFGITYNPDYNRESDYVCPTYHEEGDYEEPCPTGDWQQIKSVFGNDLAYFWTSDYDQPDSAFIVSTWGALINQGRIQYDGWLQSPLCK